MHRRRLASEQDGLSLLLTLLLLGDPAAAADCERSLGDGAALLASDRLDSSGPTAPPAFTGPQRRSRT